MPFDDPAWLAQERQWVSALRAGDGNAFDRLFEAYAQPLYRRILLPRLGDAAAAEDALAETFRKAFERLDSYKDKGQGLWPYFTVIAMNQAHDMQRERARRGRALASFASLLPPLPTDTPDEHAGPALRAAIDTVLGQLNPRYARAIQLRFLDERRREDCATVMEVKLGTFDVLLLRALRAFRQKWQESFAERPESVA